VPAKALLPMLSSPSGRVTPVTRELLENAPSSILVTPAGIATVPEALVRLTSVFPLSVQKAPAAKE
jgi:hypothetical protein